MYQMCRQSLRLCHLYDITMTLCKDDFYLIMTTFYLTSITLYLLVLDASSV